MATATQIRPCPRCGLTEFMAVYNYDGWRHVECDNGFNSNPTPPASEPCHYLGPGAGSIRQAIKLHNDRVDSNPPSAQEGGE